MFTQVEIEKLRASELKAPQPTSNVLTAFFMASGSTVKVALELGRKAIRVELEEGRFNQTTEEIRGFSQGS
ncbi:site-specific DNA-methyltransferase [Enterobacter asburiae]|uniref:site-specific DNA-methyltransferase n=1 Tax=Enterobacter asburiae TaxID=61645 RepID=UPI001881F78E